jgi:hypothetical protein
LEALIASSPLFGGTLWQSRIHRASPAVALVPRPRLPTSLRPSLPVFPHQS